jgi:hypothetical protein
VLARDSSGILWIYPGTGTGHLGWPTSAGDGWNNMTAISAAGDLNSDGKPDLVARNTNGTLLIYPGTGTGHLGWPTSAGDGWNNMTAIS